MLDLVLQESNPVRPKTKIHKTEALYGEQERSYPALGCAGVAAPSHKGPLPAHETLLPF